MITSAYDVTHISVQLTSSASVEGGDGGPLSGSLLASLIEDLGDKRLAINRVVELENVGRDFNQERVQDSCVPFFEDRCDLGFIKTQSTLEDIICLCDQLHVTVFNTYKKRVNFGLVFFRTRNVITVVDHLDVVSGTVLTDPVTAWDTLNLSSSGLENFLDMGPCSGVSTGHERRTKASTLLTTRHTTSDEKEALGLKLLDAASGIGVMRVTTINDDVTLFEMGYKLVDECIDGRAGLYEKNNLARGLEFGDELLDRVRALDIGAYFLLGKIERKRLE